MSERSEGTKTETNTTTTNKTCSGSAHSLPSTVGDPLLTNLKGHLNLAKSGRNFAVDALLDTAVVL